MFRLCLFSCSLQLQTWKHGRVFKESRASDFWNKRWDKSVKLSRQTILTNRNWHKWLVHLLYGPALSATTTQRSRQGHAAGKSSGPLGICNSPDRCESRAIYLKVDSNRSLWIKQSIFCLHKNLIKFIKVLRNTEQFVVLFNLWFVPLYFFFVWFNIAYDGMTFVFNTILGWEELWSCKFSFLPRIRKESWQAWAQTSGVSACLF